MNQLASLDWVVVGLYFVVVFAVAIGATVRRSTRDSSSGYFLAGRDASWIVIAASLFASNIGSEHLVGLAGTAAASGVAVGQFELLACFMLLLLGWVFVPFYLRSGVFTMPEFLERRYSSAARWYLAVISVVGYVLTKISVTIAAGGIVFESLMGIDFWVGSLVVVLATGAYTIFGGLRAVLYTDLLQTVVLIAGAVCVTVLGLTELGGWSEMRDTAGSDFFDLWQPMSHPDFPWTGILLGAPILGVWYWCTDQFIVQRVLSAKGIDHARRGTIGGGFLKLLPLFLFVIPGIIAYSLSQKGQLALESPDHALPALIASLMPVGLRGLVVAGLLAALMSSLSSVFNSCSTLITWDIYRKIRPEASERRLVVVGQLATVGLVICGLLWIPMMKHISSQLYTYLQSVQAYIAPPIAAVFLLGLYWKRLNAAGAMASLVTGLLLGMGRLGAELAQDRVGGALRFYAEINFLHFAALLFIVCATVLAVVSLLTPPPTAEQTALVASRPREPGGAWGRGLRLDAISSGILVLAVLVLWSVFSGCAGTGPQEQAQKTAARPESEIDALLEKMTVEEKLGQLTQLAGAWDKPGEEVSAEHRQAIRDGKVGSFLSVFGADVTRELQRSAVEDSRLGIPLLFAFDVIHGFRTTFPVPLAEASSWNLRAIERAARIAAVEASAAGIHWTFAPMVDVARDPRWGRIVEGSGEDPYLGSMIAAARVRGFQGEDLGRDDTVMACAKHLAGYGAVEGGRDYNTVDISRQTLHEIHLPPFRAAIDAGVMTLMSAFNEVDGIPSSANSYLLDKVMRKAWGFDGFVVSDWKSIEEMVVHRFAPTRTDAGLAALRAGVDMEMVSGIYSEELVALHRAGRVPDGLIDRSVRRVLEAKEALGLFEDPYRYIDTDRERSRILTAEHRTAAREMAQQSIVLLKNSGVLPLDRGAIERLAVLGPLAGDRQAPLGPWSVPGRKEDVVSVREGLQRALPEAEIVFEEGVSLTGDDPSGIAAAVRAARSADVAILVLGESDDMSGEARNRSQIGLPGIQQRLAQEVIATGKPVVVVLMNGRPLAIEELDRRAPAIVEAWFLGVETGNAVADILFGEVNPSGKLPVTFPRVTGQIPIHYNHKNTGRPGDLEVRWSSKYIDLPLDPLYPFGHGLSYTKFGYSNLSVRSTDSSTRGSLTASFELRNVGERRGTEIVQLYARDHYASRTPPVKELIGFARVSLEPGEMRRVTFEIPAEVLGYRTAEGDLRIEPGKFDLLVASSSADVRLRRSVSLAGQVRVLASPPVASTRAVVSQ